MAEAIILTVVVGIGVFTCSSIMCNWEPGEKIGTITMAVGGILCVMLALINAWVQALD